jgi:hypothetical protein
VQVTDQDSADISPYGNKCSMAEVELATISRKDIQTQGSDDSDGHNVNLG